MGNVNQSTRRFFLYITVTHTQTQTRLLPQQTNIYNSIITIRFILDFMIQAVVNGLREYIKSLYSLVLSIPKRIIVIWGTITLLLAHNPSDGVSI